MSDKKINIEDIKSELFAIVNTIIRLNNKYLEGVIDDSFFKKSLKSAMNSLIMINFKLNEQNLKLTEVLDLMKLTQDYHKAISIINNASSLDFGTDDYSETISSSILQIPGAVSEITSSFITLMDALKLVEIESDKLIFGLFQDLLNNLDKFPGLEMIKSKTTSILANFKSNKDKFFNFPQYRNSLEDELYSVYNDFQQKLQLKI